MNIIFTKFSDAYNTGDDKIEYIVETSRDLRTWHGTSSAECSANGNSRGCSKEAWERFIAEETRTADGNTQFIRVRVKSR